MLMEIVNHVHKVKFMMKQREYVYLMKVSNKNLVTGREKYKMRMDLVEHACHTQELNKVIQFVILIDVLEIKLFRTLEHVLNAKKMNNHLKTENNVLENNLIVMKEKKLMKINQHAFNVNRIQGLKMVIEFAQLMNVLQIRSL